MAKRKVLGLDLGVGSIGWALLQMEDEKPQQIVALGSRIVPISNDDSDQFQKGQAITKNADRTQRRTARKGYDRYQQRRTLLTEALRQHNMLPQRMDENVIDLWHLRARAASEQISLTELGRVLYHINQKRGYKHAKADNSGDKKQTDYVKEVNGRFEALHTTGKTLGQYFYERLRDTAIQNDNGGVYYTFRIRGLVYPRKAYIEEFEQIMRVQQQYYPDVLTDAFIKDLRDGIIFYQRPLKSCKHLVGYCEFEKKEFTRADGKKYISGPKCAPRTSPLAQLCAMWEMVNNITLTNKNNEKFVMTLEQREGMVKYLNENEKMGLKDMQKILDITQKDGWWAGKAIGKGLKGNNTLAQIRKALGGKYQNVLQMEIKFEDSQVVDLNTGEVIQVVSSEVENTPLFRLWHVLYSIDNEDELCKTLIKQFGITDEEVLDALCRIDFVKPGYANKSHKFIRRLLPYLMKGYQYSEACEMVGVNHSNSLTKEQNEARVLLDKLPLLEKNALRQPVIEKILNQMINVVNALRERYGEIDEIRVELARELKQSKDEREGTYKRNNENERENKTISDRLKEEGLTPTRNRIQRYKMWQQFDKCCPYCGKTITDTEFKNGEAEIEHIIPQSVLFDDSFSNKILAHHKCNSDKNNLTAREYMEQKGEAEVARYINTVNEAKEKGKISKTKWEHLLWYKKDIPADFIDRQLRQSQYIARKAVEILKAGYRNVYTTSGNVTDFLRSEWGYNEVLELLNLPRYKEVDYMTEWNEAKHRESIIGWTKRMDHRHHAIDAVTIAQTSQSVIQRLNTLNASREQMLDDVQKEAAEQHFNEKKSLLQKWVDTQAHLPVSVVKDAADGILISFRAGKRVTTPAKRAVYHGGKRTVVQTGLLVPRGALSEETVYGKQGDKYVVKYPLTHPSMKPENIIDPTIRQLVKDRIQANGGNQKTAFAEPLYSAKGMEIKSVRCYTGLKDESMRAVRCNGQGEGIGFVKTGNNHHIAIYQDTDGKYHEQVVSFWDAVERKHYGVPVVIDNPKAVWDNLFNTDLPQEFMETLPHDDWQFVVSMQQNEMFILGMEDSEYATAMENKDYQILNKYLYRVQKLAKGDYFFRYHTETSVDDKYNGKTDMQTSKDLLKLKRISIQSLSSQHPHKVRINILGELSEL